MVIVLLLSLVKSSTVISSSVIVAISDSSTSILSVLEQFVPSVVLKAAVDDEIQSVAEMKSQTEQKFVAE